MREWHARHGRDEGDQELDVPVMPSRGQSRAVELIRDRETRIKEELEYRERVDAVYAAYNSGRREQRSELAAPDNPDRPVSGIAKRRLPEQEQQPDVAATEKRRLPSKWITYWAATGAYVINTAAEHLSVIPHSFANDVSGGIVILAAGIVLRRGKHREDGNADRPED
jgi:hypothetical protein